MDRRKLGLYLLLNAVVSALVTGIILFFYDRARQAEYNLATPPATATVDAASVFGNIQVAITSVSGAGTAASEIVVLENNGEGVVVLTDWRLQDEDGNTYLFPQLTLFPGGTIQLHTASGADSAMNLFWDRVIPVWDAGEKAMLYDNQGNLHFTYQVP
ncbi:MAG: lamin tail domain-containing protein [Chloroflexota bacterium]